MGQFPVHFRNLSKIIVAFLIHTVDGRNPAPPDMYETL